MIIVTGIAVVAAKDIDTVKDAARIMAQASHAEAGCNAYAFYEDIEKSGRFRIYEQWESADALRAHFATQHMATFSETLRKADVLSLEVEQFQRGDDIQVNG